MRARGVGLWLLDWGAVGLVPMRMVVAVGMAMGAVRMAVAVGFVGELDSGDPPRCVGHLWSKPGDGAEPGAEAVAEDIASEKQKGQQQE